MVDIYNKLSTIYGRNEIKRAPKISPKNSPSRRHSTSSVPGNGKIVKSDNSNGSLKGRGRGHRFSTVTGDTYRSRNSFNYPYDTGPIVPNYASFKTSLIKNTPHDRPLMGSSCNKCHPRMRIDNEVPPLTSLGMSNILRVPTQNRDRNIISRTFYYASFVMTRKTDSNFPDVCNKVLRCDRVKSAIKDAAKDEFEEIKEEEAGAVDRHELKNLETKHRARAVVILQRMKSCISSSLLRIAGWVLYKLLSRMLSSILYHKGQIEMLRRTRMTAATTPIIYLPLHRSHLDYILVSFVLYMNNIKPPLVAAGDNLLIPFFGTLMRGLGAFFIKRRLDHKSGKKDHVYRAILHSYMTENLREGHSMEFFIEGGRSRSGKALMPKSGLLSVIVDSVLDGVVDDAFIVPVAISYEKLIDGSFVGEQLGKPKVMESFGLAARAIWSTLHSNFGSVRVDFCHPFSLKEYLNKYLNNRRSMHIMHMNMPMINKKNHDDCRDDNSCAACSGLRSTSSSSSLYGLDIVVSEDKRQTIEELAEHVVFDAFNSTALMSTQLVAFLLLTRHRKGTTLHQLTQSLNWLRDECARRRRDIGFTGESIDAIKYACNLLGKDLVAVEKISMAWSSPSSSLGADGITENNNNVKIVFLKPAVKLPQVLELQYYSNTCVSMFQMDSAIVNALYSLVSTEMDTLSVSGDSEKKIYVFYDDLLQRSIELCNMLQYDFIFAPPCTSISDVVTDTIESLIFSGLLEEDRIVTADDQQLKNKFKYLDFDDEDEDDGYLGSDARRKLRLVISDENLSQMQFLRSVLSAYIESYWIASCSLIKLVNTEKEDKIFFSDMLNTAKERQHQGMLCHEESIAAEPLKNAIKLFESWKVLQSASHDSVRILFLNKEFDNDTAVNDVILKFEKFKK